jgi:SAM-dependent methyltransferase
VDIDAVLVSRAAELAPALPAALCARGTLSPTPGAQLEAPDDSAFLESWRSQLSPDHLPLPRDTFSDIAFMEGDVLKAPCIKTLALRVPGGFDVIFLLSVTKWVHLNGGDDALRQLFAATVNLLRPGGILVLEPQRWRSYKQRSDRQGGNPAFRAMRTRLRLRPETDFLPLLQNLGLQLLPGLSVLGDSSPTSSKGRSFSDRSIFVLQRPRRSSLSESM